MSLWSWNGAGSGDNGALEEPELLAHYDHHHGDVNDLVFLNPDFAVAASSSGTVTVLRLARDDSGWLLQEVNKWENLQ